MPLSFTLFIWTACRRYIPVTAALLLALLPGRVQAQGGEARQQAENAMAFFRKMQTNLIDRAQRLKAAGVLVEAKTPFVDSAFTINLKESHPWSSFMLGDLEPAVFEDWQKKALAELESARKELAKAEATVAAATTKQGKPQPPPPVARGSICGTEIEARRLAVLLTSFNATDRRWIAGRTEVTARFPAARFVEILYTDVVIPGIPPAQPVPVPVSPAAWFFASPRADQNPFDKKWFLPEVPQENLNALMEAWKRDTAGAFTAMTELMEADTILWFNTSFFKMDEAVIGNIGSLLAKKKTKLYLFTEVTKETPASLEGIVRKSGGKIVGANFSARPDPDLLPVFDISPALVQDSMEMTAKHINTGRRFRWYGEVKQVDDSPHRSTFKTGNPHFNVMLAKDAVPGGAAGKAALLEQLRVPGCVYEAVGEVTSLTSVTPALNPQLHVETAGFLRVHPPGWPANASPLDDFRKINLTAAEIQAGQGKDVKFDAVIKRMERMAAGNHVKVYLEGTPLFAICKADLVAAVFPGIDPVKDLKPGGKVQIGGRLTLFQKVPMVSLEKPYQFRLADAAGDSPAKAKPAPTPKSKP